MKPKRLTREESKVQTRERLLQAARHVFAQGGYGGASVDNISAEAGFSKGAFYSNFETKEALFLELLARHMAAETEQLEQLLGTATAEHDIFEQLNKWLEHLDADADWALLSIELQLHARRSPAFAASYDQLFASHCTKLGAMIERLFSISGKKPPLAASSLAAALITLAHGLVVQGHQASCRQHVSSGTLMKLFVGSLIAGANKVGA